MVSLISVSVCCYERCALFRLVKEGDRVSMGDEVCEVQSDKVLEICASSFLSSLLPLPSSLPFPSLPLSFTQISLSFHSPL